MKIIKQLFNGHAGIFILPDDYLTGEPLPLIVFDAGVGEQQGGRLDTVDSLYNNGVPLALARDGKLNNVADPVTGKVYRFAVFGVQGNGWCVPPVEIAAMVKQLFGDYPMLDKTCVFKTGLSAGGQNTWQAITDPTGSIYTAAVAMSTPQCSVGPVLNCKIWAQHGTSDGGITDAQYDYNLVAKAKYGWAFYTGYAGGHGGWSVQYDPNTRYTLPGYAKPVNVYEFALMLRSNPSFIFTAAGVPGGATGTTPPTMSTKANVTFTQVGNDVIFDLSGSTGTFGGWDIKFDKSSVNAWGGKNLPTAQKLTLANGVYVASVGVYDVAGGKDVAQININVPAAVVNVPPVVTPPPVPPVTPPSDPDPVVTTKTITYIRRQSGKEEVSVK